MRVGVSHLLVPRASALPSDWEGGRVGGESWARVAPAVFFEGPFDYLSYTSSTQKMAVCVPSVQLSTRHVVNASDIPKPTQNATPKSPRGTSSTTSTTVGTRAKTSRSACTTWPALSMRTCGVSCDGQRWERWKRTPALTNAGPAQRRPCPTPVQLAPPTRCRRLAENVRRWLSGQTPSSIG